MAVVTILSGQITNDQATPPVLNNPFVAGAGLRELVDVCAIGATDTATSQYRYFRIPSNARISDIELMNDAMTAGTSYKAGVYGINGGVVPVTNSDVIFFSTMSVVAARSTWTSIYFPSILNAGGLVANVTKRVWELLGLTTDPNLTYDLVVTAVTAATAGGNLALKLAYTT